MFHERGEWGAAPQAGSNTWIITGYDHERFLRTLFAAAQRAAPEQRMDLVARRGLDQCLASW